MLPSLPSVVHALLVHVADAHPCKTSLLSYMLRSFVGGPLLARWRRSVEHPQAAL